MASKLKRVFYLGDLFRFLVAWKCKGTQSCASFDLQFYQKQVNLSGVHLRLLTLNLSKFLWNALDEFSHFWLIIFSIMPDLR